MKSVYMEMNKKIPFYRFSMWTLIVLLPVLATSFFYDWGIEILFYCTLAWSVIVVSVSLFNNYELLKNSDAIHKATEVRNEGLIVEGKAKQIRGKRKVEGILCLTNSSINFKAKDLEIIVLSLKKIESVKLCKYYGILTKGIAIKRVEGTSEQFILNYAKDWKRLIDCSIQDAVSKK